MAFPSRLSVALANLQKSHEFLLKILEACDNLPEAPGTISDEEMMLAVSRLAQLTATIIQGGEQARQNGGVFLAAQAFPEAVPGLAPSKTSDETTRQRIIMQMCLQQSDLNWRQARFYKAENGVLRRGLKQVEADVAAARAALPPLPAKPPRPVLVSTSPPSPRPTERLKLQIK